MVKKEDALLAAAALRRVADAIEREAEKGGETPVTDAVLAPKPLDNPTPQATPEDPEEVLYRMWNTFSSVFGGHLRRTRRSPSWVVGTFTGTEAEGEALRKEALLKGVERVFVRDGRAGFKVPAGAVVGRRDTYWPSGRLPVGYYDPADWDHDDDESGAVFSTECSGEHDFW